MTRTLFNDDWHYRARVNPFTEMTRRPEPKVLVQLPHDAMIGLVRSPDLEQGAATAYFPSVAFEYSKTFELPAEPAGGRVIFEFEGVYRDAVVYVNNDFAGQWATGYSRFLVDASDLVNWGASNEIRVEGRSHEDSRWYAGAGIYRSVWMNVMAPVHLPVDGVVVTTPDVEPARAVVEIAVSVANSSMVRRVVSVESTIVSPSGETAARVTSRVTVLPGEVAVSRNRAYVHNPAFWSVDSPELYRVDTELRDGGDVLQTRSTAFGIRTLQLDPIGGLRINGATVKLRGACIHHDNGIIGAATVPRAEERRVERLKAAGFNAIRSSHYPLSPAMLDACDRLGMLVLDEAFDMWAIGKTDFGPHSDFPEWWERDLAAMVAKDINHPSVIMYSIGNEVLEVATPMGGVWGRRLAEKVRALDPNRFVTNGVNGMLSILPEILAGQAAQSGEEVNEGKGINAAMADAGEMMNIIGASPAVTERTAETFEVLDIAGMNYLEGRYELDRDLFPNRIILGTETFPARIDKLWSLVMANDHVIGDFTWTGWDYLGEVGIGATTYAEDGAELSDHMTGYPWIAAWCGDIDIIGDRRPASFYREIVFGLRAEPYIAVLRPQHHGKTALPRPWSWSDSVSSWSWDGFEGRPVVVEVYSDADEVELLVNGTVVGRAPAGAEARFRASFQTEFVPGSVEAVAYRDGVEVSRTALQSASGPERLLAATERAELSDGVRDLMFVEITVGDSDGIRRTVDREVAVEIAGPGVLMALGSANPAPTQSYGASAHTTFDGRALAVVRPSGPGEITVTVRSEGLEPATVTSTVVVAVR